MFFFKLPPRMIKNDLPARKHKASALMLEKPSELQFLCQHCLTCGHLNLRNANANKQKKVDPKNSCFRNE